MANYYLWSITIYGAITVYSKLLLIKRKFSNRSLQKFQRHLWWKFSIDKTTFWSISQLECCQSVQVKKPIYAYVWALNILLSSFIFPFVDPRQPEQGESGQRKAWTPSQSQGCEGKGQWRLKKKMLHWAINYQFLKWTKCRIITS